MTDAVLVALVATIPPTLATLLTAWQSRKGRKKAVVQRAELAEKQDAIIEKQEHMAAGQQEIHILVNGRLSEALERNAELELMVRELGGDPRVK